MSGILAIFNQDGTPVTSGELSSMAAVLERRGPERTAICHDGPMGLGHTLLATTPEAQFERLPLSHRESGCSITADARLDNRNELLAWLGHSTRASDMGDGELILEAYLAWGERCVERLLGDFAFAIWDARQQLLFCARDHMGMKPLYYHHTPGRFVVVASESRAVVALPQTPYRINEGRIADYLVNPLEGIDKTSTFFEEVFRLPPAHSLSITPEGMRLCGYWRLEPGSQLHLRSDEAYAEAFLEVFTEAVRCRLRASPGTLGSMLSGGMDSGSVVAVASQLLAEGGQGPLPTFSAVGPDPETCVETRTIHAALTTGGLKPHRISYDRLEELEPGLLNLTWSLDEPFDFSILIEAIYLMAHRSGIKVLLDGVGGDSILSEGSHLARLLRRGRWLTAVREAVGQNQYWRGAYPARQELYRAMRAAFVPNSMRRIRRRLRRMEQEQQLADSLRESFISQDFARRVALSERLRTLDSYSSVGLIRDSGRELALSVEHPFLTVGRERYERTAAAVAVEPRDPFVDRRLAAFCVSLPSDQKLADGWPKAILRRAMAGHLPDSVRWRRGKEHLGWRFSQAFIRQLPPIDFDGMSDIVSPYIDVDRFRRLGYSSMVEYNPDVSEGIYEVVQLAVWLMRHAQRPGALVQWDRVGGKNHEQVTEGIAGAATL